MINLRSVIISALLISTSSCQVLIPDEMQNKKENANDFYGYGIYDAVSSIKREVRNVNKNRNKLQNLTGRYIVYSRVKTNDFTEIIRLKNIAMKMNLFDTETVINQDNESLLLFSINSRPADALLAQKMLKEANILTTIEKVDKYMSFKYNPIITKDIIWDLKDVLKDVPTKVIVVEKKRYIPVETIKVVKEKKKEIKTYSSKYNAIKEKEYSEEKEYSNQYGTKKIANFNKKEIKKEAEKKYEKISEEKKEIKKEEINYQKEIEYTLKRIREKGIKVKNKNQLILNNTVYEANEKIDELTIEKIFDKEKGNLKISYIVFKEDLNKKAYSFAAVKKIIPKNDNNSKEVEEKNTTPNKNNETSSNDNKVNSKKNKEEVEEKNTTPNKNNETSSNDNKVNSKNLIMCDFSKIKRIYKKTLGKFEAIRITQNSIYFNKDIDGKVIGKEKKLLLVMPSDENFERFYISEKYLQRGYCNER